MKRSKKIVSLLIALVMLLGCLNLSGCGIFGSSVGDSELIICKASDFESLKDNWYSGKGLAGKKAKDAHITELEMGESYYFVCTMKSIKEGNHAEFEFGMKAWGGLYFGKDAVTFDADRVVVDGDIRVQYDKEGNVIGYHVLSNQDRAYAAVPFTPKYGGMLYVNCALTDYDMYEVRPWGEKVERVSATVMSSTEDMEAEVTISNLSYGLVSADIYESGQLDSETDLASISEMKTGKNYVVMDFEITSKNDFFGEVYCSIYMHKGDWRDAEIEQANTAKSVRYDMDGGKFFDFSYSTPQNDTKKVRTVLSFTTSSSASVDFEFFVYGDKMLVKGETHACDSFAVPEVSTLKYRLDKDAQAYYVTGYENMTGKVHVPGYHKGLPVMGVDAKAFKGCKELKNVNLNKVETVGNSAFEDCTELLSCYGGTKLLMIGERAFANCSTLGSIHFPETICTVGKDAYLGTTSVELYSFKNMKWIMDGELLKFPGMTTKKNILADGHGVIQPLAAVWISDLRIYMIKEESYLSGNIESATKDDWDTYKMFKDKCPVTRSAGKYYWVVDFSANLSGSDMKNLAWYFYFDTDLKCDFVLKEAIGPEFWYHDAGNSKVIMHYKNCGSVEIRLIFESTVEKSEGTITACFGGDAYYVTGQEEDGSLTYGTTRRSMTREFKIYGAN